MITRYVWRDVVRNPRRTLSTVVGISLGVGLLSALLFFIDGSAASMTQRALAPLPLDMQRVLTNSLGPGLRLTQTVQPAGAPSPGRPVVIDLRLTNRGDQPANEVVLRSQPPPGLRYLPGSTVLDGAALPDTDGDLPLAHGPGQAGLNLGTLAPGATVSVAYQAEAGSAGSAAASSAPTSSFSSREVVTPVAANAPDPLSLHDLATALAQLDGVASADELSFVDLAPGSLSAGSRPAPGTVRLFGFGPSYRQRVDGITIVSGTQEPGQALLSTEAAQVLSIGPGDTVTVGLPDGTALELRVSGITDLTRARALFYSRQGSNLEEFLYTPQSVVVDPETFNGSVLPAFRAATTTRGAATKSVPILEVDIGVQRSRLDADPGTALAETGRIAAAVNAVAPGQDYLIDNISNTLQVARDDAAVAKRMFVFLGLPGAILAAMLASYAGSVLAAAQRREQATLRLRGANRRHLQRMLLVRTLLLAGVGSLLGVGIGLLAALAVLGPATLATASSVSLLGSAFLGAGIGFLATGGALYLAGRRAITRDIAEGRTQLAAGIPVWWRAGLDAVVVVATAVATVVALRADAFAGLRGSVYDGRGVRLNLLLLVLPLGAGTGATLVAARLFALLCRGLGHRPIAIGGHLGALLGRSLRRRRWAAAAGVTAVALIVGLGTSLAAFNASYDAAKAADARFVVGSDIRITPSPTGARPLDAGYTATLERTGIAAVTPVVFGVQNAVLRSARNEDAANVAAIDPASFLTVAPLDDANFVDLSARQAMTALAGDATGLLLSTEMADFLSLQVGDPVRALLARAQPDQALTELHVLGLFERLPGFPEGVQAAINLRQQVSVVPSTVPSFFLARNVDDTHATLAAVVDDLRNGPGAVDELRLDTRETALDKDQSSLAALNIQGLLSLDSSFALAMGTVAVAVFVFGLLLQRRREYVTLRAQGLHAREVRVLITAEAGVVTVCGCLAGVVAGVAMAFYFVNVLRPLFVSKPPFVVPLGGVAVLAVSVLASAAVIAVAATSIVNRLRPTELLRDE